MEILTPLERRTGRQYVSEAERRLVSWVKEHYPRYIGVAPPLGFDPEREAYLRGLDDRQYGLVPVDALEAGYQDILVELGE